jgi:hypothetical protein
VWAATLIVRQQDGDTRFSAELGATVDMEVVIDTGTEELTGFSFFLSFDASVFRVITDAEGAPFQDGEFLSGVVLLNRSESIDGETVLGFTAAAGVQRQTAAGEGVVARFQLEVLRRPPGDEAIIALGDWGHDRQTHYLLATQPGTEIRFAAPLGIATARLTGFRIRPFPAVTVIEGEPQELFDLDEFVDQDNLDVLWTASQPTEVPVSIDPETNIVLVEPELGVVGQRQVAFIALEIGEGLTAFGTVDLTILSRPKIRDFPDTLAFPEDQARPVLGLDAFVSDLDDPPESLSWILAGNDQLEARIDPENRGLSLSAAPNWFGAEVLQLSVSDKDGLVDTVSVTVQVTPVNDPPVAHRLGPVYPVAGEAALEIVLASLIEDIDDPVSATIFTLDFEGPLAVEVQGDTLLLVSGLEPGRGILRYALEDSAGAQAQGQLVAVVVEVEGRIAPEIAAVPELVFNNTETLDVDLSTLVEDDGAPESLVLTAEASQGLVAQIIDGRLQVAAPNGFSGRGQVELQVRDADGNQDIKIIEVEALPSEQPAGPVLIGPAKLGVVKGNEIVLPLTSLTPQAEALTWDVGASEGITPLLSETGQVLSLQVEEGFDGPGVVQLSATGDNGQSTQITIPVLTAEVGGPPQVLPIDPLILEGAGASKRIDLDDFVFDDADLDSELLWTARAEAGVEVELDPVRHKLTVTRREGETTADAAQVLLQVRDTDGLENSVLLRVELPLLFEVRDIAEIHFFTGQIDSSLVLNDFVDAPVAIPLVWQVLPTDNLVVEVDPTTGQVQMAAREADFQGAETVIFIATDPDQRQRQVPVRVIVDGLGLSPQVRPLDRIELEPGAVDSSLDLDDFVIDDDADSALVWEVGGASQLGLEVRIDPVSHIVEVDASGAQPGRELVPLLVRDAAGNFSQVSLEVNIRQGGQAPVLGVLPRLVVAVGGEEVSLGLDVFVSDENDPDATITWEVEAPPGVAARIENRRLVVSVPAAVPEERVLELTATDPEGNQAVGQVRLVIEADPQPPALFLSVRRHPVFEELQVFARSNEELAGVPAISADGLMLEVEEVPEDRLTHSGTYQVLPVTGAQIVEMKAAGTDRAGNTAERVLPVSLQGFDTAGGSLLSPDRKMVLNVPQAAAAPGRLGVIYQADEGETPPQNAGQPVYWIDLAREHVLGHPVNINVFVGGEGDETLGLLHWDAAAAAWEELATGVDQANGWLTASVDQLGFFRVGKVLGQNRIAQAKLTNYPNPFPTARMDETQIVYELDVAGPVRLEIFNGLGQRVEVLVDESFQQVGVWTAVWDGTDQKGQRLASGIYFYELREEGRRQRRSMLMVR